MLDDLITIFVTIVTVCLCSGYLCIRDKSLIKKPKEIFALIILGGLAGFTAFFIVRMFLLMTLRIFHIEFQLPNVAAIPITLVIFMLIHKPLFLELGVYIRKKKY